MPPPEPWTAPVPELAGPGLPVNTQNHTAGRLSMTWRRRTASVLPGLAAFLLPGLICKLASGNLPPWMQRRSVTCAMHVLPEIANVL